mmetsp:Transcript_117150/g.250329  ORF Transcript_117150/g.250329 Transcript_117150/m.250329 type:complete len:457 (-) Transcript_117150:117-1487(-)
MSSFAIIAAFFLLALRGQHGALIDDSCFSARDVETSLLQTQTGVSMRERRVIVEHHADRLAGTSAANRMPELCVRPGDLSEAVEKATTNLLSTGMPAWPAQVPAQSPVNSSDIVVAFLIQVSYPDFMPMIRRTFDRLHSPQDVFLYLVDEKHLDLATVKRSLPHPLPSNVHVSAAPHAQYYFWPRVEVVLQGLEAMLAYPWDMAVHLSESDYPVHSMDWIRRNMAAQRGTNFMEITPRCSKSGLTSTKDNWNWWSTTESVASCGNEFDVVTNEEVNFPMAQLEGGGYRFARGAEWVAVTRELVQYALSPELRDYRTLVGTHFAADEIFWQSMVLNIPNFTQPVSPQGWFIRWGHGKTGHSPDTLTEDYKQEILNDAGSYLFMRKVSLTDSAHLLDDFDAFAASETYAPVRNSNDAAWDQDVVLCTADMGLSSSVGWEGTKSVQQLQDRVKLFMDEP